MFERNFKKVHSAWWSYYSRLIHANLYISAQIQDNFIEVVDNILEVQDQYVQSQPAKR